MNRILTFVLICIFCSYSLSGQDFVIEPNPSFVEGVASNAPLIAYAELTNNTNEVQTVLWERIVEDISSGWTTNVCTSQGCIPAEIPVGDFSILPGESLNVDIQFNTISIIGEGWVEVKLSFDSDTANCVIVAYQGTAMTSSLKEESTENIQIFPNPVENFFEIKNGETVHQIKIINIFGHHQVIDAHPFSKVNVQKLTAGLYHVMLYDIKGMLLKTVPLTVF